MHKPPLPTKTLGQSRSLRRQMTDAEHKLWQVLRGCQLEGMKFRRQHPMPPYSVDFHCDAVRLAVDLDGSQHSEEADLVRTRYLQSQGLEVIRFWDNDVLLNIEGVVDAIRNSIAALTLTPTPLPTGEGLKTRPNA